MRPLKAAETKGRQNGRKIFFALNMFQLLNQIEENLGYAVAPVG
jgi:hypothetical protein